MPASHTPDFRDCILLLDELTIESFLVRKLKEKYYPIYDGYRERVIVRIEKMNKNIEYFKNNYPFKKGENFVRAIDPEYTSNDMEIDNKTGIYSKPVNSNINFELLAQKASLYFRQGKELLRSAQDISEFSRPILDYYAYLQIIKGVIILNFEINDSNFLSYHGIVPDRNANYQYITPRVKKFGVLQLLLISLTHLHENSDHNNYIKKFTHDVRITLEECIDMIKGIYEVIPLYIFLWSLSFLVRYSPEKWQLILSGRSEDELIRKIRRIRNINFPSIVHHLLREYSDERFYGW